MALDKAIKYGKEKRKPYRDSRRFDHSCRHGGSCSYCYNNRQVNKIRAGINKKAEQEGLEAYYNQQCKYPI